MEAQVTVLIPFYNPGHYLVEAIESVYAQTYNKWKILLVNDASTDNSPSLIQNYINEDNRVRLINNAQNVGQPKSMNLGLDEIDTAYTIQLDADDWLSPNCLEVLIREMEKQPEDVALVSGNIDIIFEDTNGNYVKSKIKKGRPFDDKYKFLKANSSVWPRFYRTSALQNVGGWPTDGPYEGRYVEDFRVLFRLIEQYRFHWIDEVLYYHRRHADNQTNLTQAYAESTEWIVLDSLKRWGDHYEPVFMDQEGWRLVKELKRKNILKTFADKFLN